MKKKIVTIGGGTGQFPVLSGLKDLDYDITAIVSMADDGGSTGVLRDELGVLPPGDAKQCLVALSGSSMEMRELMNYRFDSGSLAGHSIGNLLLSALEKMNGSFVAGLDEASRILNVAGRVLPASEDDMRLRITLNNGETLEGESHLDDSASVREHGVHDVTLTESVRACKEATAAISESDIILIGPGDLYASILPNLMVSGISRAIKKSKAKCVFIAPLTNKRGITESFRVADYVAKLERYLGRGRVDFVLYNSKSPSKKVIEYYENFEGKNSLVLCDFVKETTYKRVVGDFLSTRQSRATKGDKIAKTRSFIRHDQDKLSRALAFLIDYDGIDPFDIM